MSFQSQQNQMQSKGDFIKHQSKKLLGGNGSPESKCCLSFQGVFLLKLFWKNA